MKVGVQLPEIERRFPWSEIRTMARAAENGDLDSVWLGEHLIYATDSGHRGPWDAFTMLAALAEATDRVVLGSLVAATPFHHPGMVARRAAALDEVSGGRFVLGLGAGWNKVEFDAFGLPYDRRTDRFVEAFTIIRTLLRDGAVDFHGTHYELSGCVLDPPGPTPGGPPLLIGSTGPRVLAATLPHVAMWNAWYTYYGNDPEQAPALLATVDEACAAVGRRPETLEKTLAMLWHFESAPVNRDADHRIKGPEAMAASLTALHAAGAAAVQLVLDPITVDTVEQTAAIVAAWRTGNR